MFFLDENKKPGFGQKLNAGLGAALEEAEKHVAEHKATQLRHKENAAAKKLGIDIEDISDPKMRQAIMTERLKGKIKQENQEQMLKMIFGDQEGQSPENIESMLPQDNQVSPEQPSMEPSLDAEGLEPSKKEPPQRKSQAKVQPNQPIPQDVILKTAIQYPQLAARMQGHNDELERERRHGIDRKDKQTEISSKERREDHKESQKFDDDLRHKNEIARKQVEAIKTIEKSLDSGNVKPNSIANIFKGLGPIGDKISAAFLNGDQSALLAAIPQLLEGWKEVFGVRLTDADLKLLEDKLPSLGKTPEANRSVMNILKKYSDMNLLRGKIADDIVKKNNNFRPRGFARIVDERFDEMTKPVRVVNPSSQKVIEIPAYRLSKALEMGATLADE